MNKYFSLASMQKTIDNFETGPAKPIKRTGPPQKKAYITRSEVMTQIFDQVFNIPIS